MTKIKKKQHMNNKEKYEAILCVCASVFFVERHPSI